MRIPPRVRSWLLLGVASCPALAEPVSSAPSVEYQLVLLPGPAVEVTLRFDGDADGITDLELSPSWGGHENDGSDVGDLSITSGERAIAFEHAEPWRWSATHPAGAPLEVRYTIHRTPARGIDQGGNDYRTRLHDGFFQMTGNLGLLMPGHVEGEAAFSIRFRRFDEAGWKVMSSWGSGAGPFEVRADPGRFLHSMVFAGSASGDEPTARFHERDIEGNRVGVAIRGSQADWGFTDDQFIELATRIIRVERDFFHDHTDPWFLVTLTPEGRATGGSFSLGGTGLGNCFALYCNTGLSLAPGSPYADRIAILLAHEYFHTWNGLKIPTASDDGSGYWFSEGFTNFYARRLLLDAGLIDASVYTENLNEGLAGYDANPFRAAPNARIMEGFWKDQNLGQLPYHRGELIASALDERLRAAGGSLDDFMRGLLAESRAAREVTSEQLLARIESATDAAFGNAIRAAVLDGAEVPVPERLTRPALALSSGRMRSFDPGFDAQASAKAGRVIGVKPGSGAFEAGLRDGLTFQGYELVPGNADGPPRARATLEINGQPKVVEFEAVGPETRVRSYVPEP